MKIKMLKNVSVEDGKNNLVTVYNGQTYYTGVKNENGLVSVEKDGFMVVLEEHEYEVVE